MQPLIMITLLGVAAAALGTGFLSTNFDLTVQQLGVQEADLTSPVKTVAVDLELFKTKVGPHIDLGGIGGTAPQTHFHNIIKDCSFHSFTTLNPGTTIICKLTDDDNDVIAEGKVILTTTETFSGSSSGFLIPIQQTVFHFSNDVQEVHDVKIVILGPRPAITQPE